MKLYVGNYWTAKSFVQQSRPDAVISIMDATHLAPDVGLPPERHLKLGFHDIERPEIGKIEPSASHISELVGFSRTQKATGARTVFLHCAAGVRRSPAAAYILAVTVRFEDPLRAATVLFEAAPFVDPNTLMIRHADAIGGFDGSMVKAIQSIRKSTKGCNQQETFFF